MEEQPGQAGKQVAADRHDHHEGDGAHNQQRDRRRQNHIEVSRHDATNLFFHPGPEDRRDQHANNIAARID